MAYDGVCRNGAGSKFHHPNFVNRNGWIRGVRELTVRSFAFDRT